MFSLLIIFNLYFVFTKLFFFFKTLLWYVFIGKLINTYWNIFIVYLLFSLFLNREKLSLLIFFNFLLISFDCLEIFTYFHIPIQLLVGYNNIHPVLFYCGFVIFFCYFFSLRRGYSFNFYSIIIILCFALLLGGLWGSGNSIWGFFWVNDKIELILLFLCMLSLFIIHSELTTYSLIACLNFFVILVIWIFLLRWGFSFTRHNFFDLHKLVNIFFVFIIINTFINLFSLMLIFFFFFSYLILYFFVIYFISLIFTVINYFRSYLFITHIFIIILGLSWVKFRHNNLLYFFLNKNIFLNSLSIKLVSTGILNNSFFLKLGFLKLFFNHTNIYFMFSVKTFFFLIFMSYNFVWSLIFFFFFLKSMGKIYK